jgi:preprotein translocase subunit SecD
VEGGGILLTAFIVCLFAVPNFFPESTHAGRHGRSATSCSASTCRAARTSCSRSMPTTCAGKLQALLDDVQDAARSAGRPRRRSGHQGNSIEVRIRDNDLQQGLTKLRGSRSRSAASSAAVAHVRSRSRMSAADWCG